MSGNEVLFWVCRSCPNPCVLLYKGIMKGDSIEFCSVNGLSVSQNWELEKHDDVPISYLLNNPLPVPEVKQ